MNYQACVCNFCGTGCGQFLKTDGKRVLGVAPIVNHPVSKGKLCVRGWHANELLNTNERITTALIRKDGRLREASLDEAISLVARRLGEFNGAADEIGLLACARSSNEDGFALRRLAREVFKTHLLGVGAEAGHRNSMDALSHAFGYPGAVGDLTRIDKADYILIVGTDIARQNPVIGGNLHAAQRRGTRVVSLSSSRTQMAKLSTKHFQQKPGTKALVLNALAKALHALRTVNHERHADIDRLAGYTQYVNALRTISSVALEAASGIRYEEIEEEAQILDAARSVVILFPSGISGLDKRTIEAICNLAVLTDRMDEAHSALIPVAGISNLQGSFDMGLSGESGHSVFGSLAAPDSPLRALFVVDHDDGIIRDRGRIAALDFVVYCGAFRNPFMDLADVILPLTAYNESDGTYTCADRRVQLTRKNTDTPGDGLPGWRLFQAIAEQAGQPGWGWRDAAEVFLAISDTIPAYHDLTHHRLTKGFGIHWDLTAFPTAGQMKFHQIHIDYPKSPTCEEFPFALMVGKGRHFWHQNNLMRKTLIPRREYDQTLLLYPQGYVEICPQDAQKLKVRDKWMVQLTSSTGTSMRIAVKVSPDVQPGTAYIPYFIKNMISDFLIRYDHAFSAGEESIIPVRIEEKVSATVEAIAMYVVTTQEINDLARELQKTHAVYGPQVHAQTGQVFFDLLEDTELLDLDAAIPSMPVKEILFPQMERILKYSYDAQAQSVTLEKQYVEQPKVLFGLRPCDLAGIACLDRFFLGQEFVDDVYLTHRRRCILITNTCTRPWDQCFCVCTHTGPAADEGFDLDLTRLADGYVVQVGSEQGQALAHAHGWKTAERRRLAEKQAVVDRSISLFPDLAKDNKAWISRAMNRITTGFVKHEVWEHIGQQCFECGACSFVCPSCSCFNIEDAKLCDNDCERLRTRDSCSFSGYTRMAGDHNPRAPVEDRRNKRFFCKLSYTQSKKYLRPGCVGCGRCQWVCPGDIGMPNVVQYIRRETTE